jgi:hypothetical protein
MMQSTDWFAQPNKVFSYPPKYVNAFLLFKKAPNLFKENLMKSAY